MGSGHVHTGAVCAGHYGPTRVAQLRVNRPRRKGPSTRKTRVITLETGPRRRLAVETGGEGDAAPRGRVRRRAGDPFKFQASSPATATTTSLA